MMNELIRFVQNIIKIIGSRHGQNLSKVEIKFSTKIKKHCHQFKNVQRYFLKNKVFKFMNIQYHLGICVKPDLETLVTFGEGVS